MARHEVQFGIGSSFEGSKLAYAFYPSQAERDTALERLEREARAVTDGQARRYQRVLSLGEGHVAHERPDAPKRAYVSVQVQVPDTRGPTTFNMRGRLELFSGEVEVLPAGASQKAALLRFLKPGAHDAVAHNFVVVQSAGQHNDRLDRTVYERIERALNRTGLRVRDRRDLRGRMLRAKALQRLQDARPNYLFDGPRREAVTNARLSELLPVTN